MTRIEMEYMESVKKIPTLLSKLLAEMKGLREDMAEVRELIKGKPVE